MRNIILVDINRGFLDDMTRTLAINEIPDIRIYNENDLNKLGQDIQQNNATEILVNAKLLDGWDWNYPIPVYSYARTKDDLELALSFPQIPCYGQISKSMQLLTAIENNAISAPTQTETYTETIQTETAEIAETAQPEVGGSTETQDYDQQMQYPAVQEGFYDEYGVFRALYPVTSYDEQGNPIVVKGYYDERYGQWFIYTPTVETPVVEQPVVEEKPAVEQKVEQQAEQISVVDSIRNKNRQKDEDIQKNAEAAFEKEFQKERSTKCITVFSAKGGVGKTTIACELSTFLALIDSHRGRYKVCVADFNIDFGDVLNTLSFDQRGATMSTWGADIEYRIANHPSKKGAKEIKKKIANDELLEDFTYTSAQISNWLQHDEKSGLYALLAPISNLDSMELDDAHIKIMLYNLIHNSDFDYVICDTGNNTRDASFIALEMADTVIMVLDQQVNNANCNNSFLHTAERINFDVDKIKLVINGVLPEKEVGVSVEEVETAFRNLRTGRPYNFESLARIPFNKDVKLAGNLGQPLVFDPNHEFTKQIGLIAKRIIGEETKLAPVKKKSLFSKLFGAFKK